jgi:hypothetical protein
MPISIPEVEIAVKIYSVCLDIKASQFEANYNMFSISLFILAHRAFKVDMIVMADWCDPKLENMNEDEQESYWNSSDGFVPDVELANAMVCCRIWCTLFFHEVNC